MAAAHPYGAFVGCGIKRIGCARRIKVNSQIFSLRRCFIFVGVVLDLDKNIFPWQVCFILEVILD